VSIQGFQKFLGGHAHLDEQNVGHAIELSQEKRCSVSAVLRKACPFNHTSG